MKKKILIALAIILAVVILAVGSMAVAIYKILYPSVLISGSGETKVVCVGDSLTYSQGVMGSRKTDAYPSVLARLLGEEYQVLNYGLPNRTLQSTGNMPYTSEDFYQASLAQDADIIIIMLGSNDSKPDFWNAERFEAEYKQFVQQYQNMASNPEVYIMIPTAIYLENPDSGDCSDEILQEQLVPIITRVAEETGAKLIDLYTVTEGHPEWYKDGLHPTAAGNEAIAQAIYEAICTE